MTEIMIMGFMIMNMIFLNSVPPLNVFKHAQNFFTIPPKSLGLKEN